MPKRKTPTKGKTNVVPAGKSTNRPVKAKDGELPEDQDGDVDSDEELQSKVARLESLKMASTKPTDTVSGGDTKAAVKGSGKAEEKKGEEKKGEAAPSKLGPPCTAAVWQQKDTLLWYSSVGTCASNKIASFDIDGTIITTQSGKVFPQHCGDWRILYPEIPGRLKKLIAEGFKVVFFTNQMGIQKGKVKVEDFKQKVENIQSKLNIPIQGNNGIEIDMKESFYVGDAAGRPADWAPGKKKDFSCGDRLFALNAGLTFLTPEEFFMSQSKAKFNVTAFNPKSIESKSLLEPAASKLVLGKQEMIVLVGSPAAGKSHFAREHLVPKGYVHVNRDTLGTWQKCVKAATDAMEKGSCVVIDNTNPDKESRRRYVDAAKDAGDVTVRCFVMRTSLEHARHNELFREMTDKKHQSISEMIFNMFKSKYAEPTVSEGFTEVVHVNFVPSFNEKNHEQIYQRYLVEK